MVQRISNKTAIMMSLACLAVGLAAGWLITSVLVMVSGVKMEVAHRESFEALSKWRLQGLHSTATALPADWIEVAPSVFRTDSGKSVYAIVASNKPVDVERARSLDEPVIVQWPPIWYGVDVGVGFHFAGSDGAVRFVHCDRDFPKDPTHFPSFECLQELTAALNQ